MTAYAIVQLNITDPQRFETYKQQVPPIIAAFGGKYLARGGPFEVLQGEWPAERTVLLEFPSLERARAWHESDEYAGPRAIRDKAARVNVVLIEGVGA